MTTPAEVLAESYGRLPDLVRDAVKGLDAQELAHRPGGTGNSIAWLIWHLTRVEDNHIADAFGRDEVWLTDGYEESWGLDLDPMDTGYGHTSEQVGAVRVSNPQQLLDYFDVVHALVGRLIAELDAEDLQRVVDDAWDPPVTLLVRLVSVVDDAVQHAGQAAYARGMILSAR